MLYFQVPWTPRKKIQKNSVGVPVTGSGRELGLCHVAKMMNIAKVTAILALCFRKSSEGSLGGLEIFAKFLKDFH